MLGVGHLSPAKHNKHSDFATGFEELSYMPSFEVKVMIVNFGPIPHFLKLKGMLLLLGSLVFLGKLILELAVIENAAHRRATVGSNFYQI